jgi:hypothetical protein
MFVLALNEVVSPGADNQPLQALNLASVTGVVGVSLFVIEILKRAFRNVPAFSKVPVFVYAIVISAGLAFIANKLFHTADGSPLLAGNVWNIIWASIIAAMGSSGFYTWLRNPEPVESASVMIPNKGDTIVTPKMIMMSVLFLSLGLISGCQACPEKAALREAMDQGTAQIRKDHKDWVTKLTIDPVTGKNHADQITPLTPAAAAAAMRAHSEYENLVSEDRKRDTQGTGLFGGK